MLSVVDLIEAGTLSRDLAAYALAAIGGGASFMVGANPGGAGKTTVMGALLNFVPRDVELAPADCMATVGRGLESATPRRCYICHEIGSGQYYAYLWGEALRAYFDLPDAGHMIATNLHADTYEEAYEQVVARNRVPDAAFRRMNLLFFLAVRGRGFAARREIATVWESDGESPHRRVFSAGGSEGAELASLEQVAQARAAIDRLLVSGARTIEEVRPTILEASSGAR